VQRVFDTHETNPGSAPIQRDLWGDAPAGRPQRVLKDRAEYADLRAPDACDRSTISVPPQCQHCGSSDLELRYCAANNGVGRQCRLCGHMAGKWLPRGQLVGVRIDALPAWARR
jgi:hypothetical protein